MKLVGELKEKVEKAEELMEAKDLIAKAGMELTDDELDGVAGGKRQEVTEGEIVRETVRKYCAELKSNPNAERKDEINKLLRSTFYEGHSYYWVGQQMGLLTR